MATTIAINGSGRFTINGVQTFLLGLTYFDGMHARQSDLTQFAQRGFNFLRIMLDWPDPTHAAGSFFNSDGTLKTTEKATLLSFIQAASNLGIVVELVILNGSSDAYLTTSGARTAAVQNACTYFGGESNVMFDVCNEIASQCAFATTFASWDALLDSAQASTSAIVYVSGDSGTTEGDGPALHDTTDVVDTSYLTSWVGVSTDVIAPHFKGNTQWWWSKYRRVVNLRAWLDSNGHSAKPILINEDNRWGTGYGDAGAGDIPADCYISTALDAKRAGAAGWVFHSNASYDLSSASAFRDLFHESTVVEPDVYDRIGAAIAADGILTPIGTVDSFTRANTGPPPSNQWVVSAGTGFKVVSNVCVGNATGEQASTWGARYYKDQGASFTIATTNPPNDAYSQALGFRMVKPYDFTSDMYQISVGNTAGAGYIDIYKLVGGAYTLLGSRITLGAALVIGDVCKATVVGSTITVYINGVSKGTRTDSTITEGGYVCLRTGDGTNGINFDNLVAGVVVNAHSYPLSGKLNSLLGGKIR